VFGERLIIKSAEEQRCKGTGERVFTVSAHDMEGLFHPQRFKDHPQRLKVHPQRLKFHPQRLKV